MEIVLVVALVGALLWHLYDLLAGTTDGDRLGGRPSWCPSLAPLQLTRGDVNMEYLIIPVVIVWAASELDLGEDQ